MQTTLASSYSKLVVILCILLLEYARSIHTLASSILYYNIICILRMHIRVVYILYVLGHARRKVRRTDAVS